ncbi:MAG TPA: YggT family protein [Solirubrobacteraceae bacterium]|jgi:YggT family protein
MTVVLATAREEIANYVQAVFYVYTLLIIAYILSSLFFAFGGRLPYSRWSSAVLGFLRDICEPFLAIFRRFIPAIGPLDLSPILAIVLLNIVGSVLANLIAG